LARPTTPRGLAALLLAALAALVWVSSGLFVGPLRAQQNWVEYRPPGEGFRVEFPRRPTVDEDDETGSRYGRAHTVTAKVEQPSGLAFYATHVVYPPGTAGREPHKVLDAERLGRTALGELRSERRYLFKGHPAQFETVAWHGPRPLVIVALDVTSGDRLYSVFCFVPPGEESRAEIQHFIDSFDLVSP